MNLLTPETLTYLPLQNSNGLLATAQALALTVITVTSKPRRSVFSFSRKRLTVVVALTLLLFVSQAEAQSQTPNSSPLPSNTAVAAGSRETAVQQQLGSEEKSANGVFAETSANHATEINQRSGSSGSSFLRKLVLFPLRIAKAFLGSFGEGSKSDTNSTGDGVGEVVGSKIFVDDTAAMKLPGDAAGAQGFPATTASLGGPNPSTSPLPQLVEFVWRSRSNQELGKILVPSGYTESTKAYTEGVQTNLGYPDGSYIILHKGGMITLPFLKPPDYEVIKSHKSSSKIVREGRERGTGLFWREENSYGVWPPLNLAFASVPKAEVNLFENAIASFEPPQDQGALVFVGSVIKIGRPPRVRCGVVAPYRLAKYRVERVIEGNYDQYEIVVDHLFCRGDELDNLKEGDVVVVKVRVTPRDLLLEQSYDGEIRKEGDEVRTFYVAKEITPVRGINAQPTSLARPSTVKLTSAQVNLQHKSPQTFCGAKGSRDLVSSDELKKRAAHRVLPAYPASCRCTGIVSVYVQINASGAVECVAPKVGHPLAALYAGRAASQWTFKPIEVNGKSVGAVGVLEFRFNDDGTVSY